MSLIEDPLRVVKASTAYQQLLTTAPVQFGPLLCSFQFTSYIFLLRHALSCAKLTFS